MSDLHSIIPYYKEWFNCDYGVYLWLARCLPTFEPGFSRFVIFSGYQWHDAVKNDNSSIFYLRVQKTLNVANIGWWCVSYILLCLIHKISMSHLQKSHKCPAHHQWCMFVILSHWQSPSSSDYDYQSQLFSCYALLISLTHFDVRLFKMILFQLVLIDWKCSDVWHILLMLLWKITFWLKIPDFEFLLWELIIICHAVIWLSLRVFYDCIVNHLSWNFCAQINVMLVHGASVYCSSAQ